MTQPKFVAPATAADALANRLAAVVRQTATNAPRSKVLAIGPSEVGEECVRKLSYKLMDIPKTNDFSDPWPSISGTAIHSWLADAFTADTSNKWLVEQKVEVTPTLKGTVDLFDVTNGIVIDHKCVGATSMKRAKSSGPSQQQLVQINLYAYGLEKAGYKVNKVALAFYPLGGSLDGFFIWEAEYRPEIALAAIQRLNDVTNLVFMLDTEKHPDRWEAIPTTPSNKCTYCPWYLPSSSDLSKGCAGQ